MCLETVPALHACALHLPATSPESGYASQPRRASPMARLARLLGDRDLYWLMSDPYRMDAPAVGALSDDLADIYLDLAQGLDAATAGFPQGACWEWRFLLWAHWGAHATGAMRALHWAAAARR